MRPDVWRTGRTRIGQVLRVRDSDLTRVGCHWMKGRLRVDDLVTPVQHSGDCFWTYQLLEGGSWLMLGANPGEPAYRICEGGRFGGYEMGVPLPVQPTEREWHLLMAGQTVNFTGHPKG